MTSFVGWLCQQQRDAIARDMAVEEALLRRKRLPAGEAHHPYGEQHAMSQPDVKRSTCAMRSLPGD
ncbi:MAG: hypothetical protein DDG58_02430 [Ardenticatenia bacterium]|nr:MAG: hypothetical protein DDG58_02430 [Ardenticatenia bacterium]